MVIKVDMFCQFGQITMDFNDHTVQFSVEGKMVKLQGIQPAIKLNMVIVDQWDREVRRDGQDGGTFLCVISAQGKDDTTTSHQDIIPLLNEYSHTFDIPKGLSPKRNMDHKIPIKPNVNPIKQHAYRYPLIQRREIEKLVPEMLQSRVIRPSSSPYSSPVLLVKKNDGSWRFCVDYSKLNAATIKDSYPISKYVFGKSEVEYLGYIICVERVRINQDKIKAMVLWPQLATIKALRGFLGLTGYYRKFIQGYGIIAKPLTDLTKKGKFEWGLEAETAFNTLKQAITTAPVLKLPDFTKSFVMETDA